MNADSPRLSLRSASRWCGAWVWAGLLGLTSPAAAQDKVPDPADMTVPAFLMAPHEVDESDLLWRDGQSLTGDLEGVQNDVLVWKSTLFRDPLKVRRQVLDRIRLATPRTETKAGFRLILTDGSCLSGEPESATAESLTFRLVHGGPVTFLQEKISRLERLKGDGVLEAGPQVLLRKPVKNPGKEVPPDWYFTAGGQVVSPGFNQSCRYPLSLPAQCAAELIVNGDSALRFSFSLKETGVACSVETWGDELVLTDGREFASAGPVLKPTDRRVHLRLAWDRPSGRRVLYHADGRVLAELTVAPQAPEAGKIETKKADRPAPRGPGGLLGAVVQLMNPQPLRNEEAIPPPSRESAVIFENRAAGVRIESFRLTEWNGQPLPPVESGAAAVETAEGWKPGALQEIREGKAFFRSPEGHPVEVALEKIRAINWHRPASLERDAALTNLWYADGDLLRGRLVQGGEGVLRLESPATKEPMNAPLSTARDIFLAKPTAPEIPLANSLPEAMLTAGKVSLRGTVISQSSGILPKFQPVGVVEPVSPVKANGMKLTWSSPADRSAIPRPQALLHLKGDETLPVTLTSINREQVEFTWNATGPRTLDPSQINAVQFPPADPGKMDFDSPAWVLAGKPGRPLSIKGEITLQPNSGIIHAQGMSGSGVSFKLNRDSGLAMIRIRLLGQGHDRTSGPISFLVADFGGSVYCGMERGDGQLTSNEEIASDGKQVTIRIDASSGRTVDLNVNGQTVAKAPRGKEKKGTSLLIESASIWGNTPSTCSVSDFVSQGSRFSPQAPGYSPDAKREALLVPRARREDPPRHVLVGLNGDLLRGEIEALTSTHLGFRAGLETFKVPLNRLTAAVWVKPLPAQTDAESKPDNNKKTFDVPASGDLEWLDLFTGGRVGLRIESWEPDAVVGSHPVMGPVRIPLTEVNSLVFTRPEATAGHAALSDWALTPTVDPVLPEEGGDASPLIGKEAKSFTVSLLNGDKFVLSKQAGKVVVLDFWATWCGPCVKSLPGLVEEMRAFPESDVVFLGLNQGEGKAAVQQFLTARKLDFKVGLDTDQKAGQLFGVEGIPHTVVVGADGKVVFSKTGYSADGEKEIAAAVRKALANRNPAEPAKE